jgi:dolichyl-phosphate beta-glucosyltransferase
MGQPVYSIVIPLYNEETRLPRTIGQITNFFSPYGEAVELIFVNDGSSDKTALILQEYSKKYNCRVLSYAQNRGKGYAVRTGALAAQGQWVLFFDVDLATPLKTFTDLQASLSERDEVVIGSRRLGQSTIKRSESKVRTALGQVFTKLSNVWVPQVTDFTCGFKCFSRAAVQKIFARARLDRWGFDTELLYIARLQGLKIREVPVEWSHDQDSRVRVGRAVVQTLWELATMTWHRARGHYQ